MNTKETRKGFRHTVAEALEAPAPWAILPNRPRRDYSPEDVALVRTARSIFPHALRQRGASYRLGERQTNFLVTREEEMHA